jgi:hypothetical protein
MTKSPNETLAEQIVTKLIDQKTICESDKTKIQKSLSIGSVKDSDWRVFFETVLATTKEDNANEA